MIWRHSVLLAAALLLGLAAGGCAGSLATTQVTWSPGDYTMEFPDADLESETDADLYRFRIEALPGGGLEAAYTGTDDDLFGSDDMDAKVLDFYLFGGFLAGDKEGVFRMPIRLGPYYDFFDLENPSAQFKWNTLGGRISLEPTVAVLRKGRFEVDLFAEGHAGVGLTLAELSTDAPGLDEDESEPSTSVAFGGEIGARVFWSDLFAAVSYIWRKTKIDDFDWEDPGVAALIDIEEPETEFEGFALTVGWRF